MSVVHPRSLQKDHPRTILILKEEIKTQYDYSLTENLRTQRHRLKISPKLQVEDQKKGKLEQLPTRRREKIDKKNRGKRPMNTLRSAILISNNPMIIVQFKKWNFFAKSARHGRHL